MLCYTFPRKQSTTYYCSNLDFEYACGQREGDQLVSLNIAKIGPETRIICVPHLYTSSGAVAQWRSGAVAQWRSGAVAQWRSGAVAQWRSGAVAQWRSGAVAQWRSGAVAQWRSGAVAQWRSGAVTQWRNGAVGRASDSGSRGYLRMNSLRALIAVWLDASLISRDGVPLHRYVRAYSVNFP